MKKLDLGQTITILANVGIIAGIVFLGVELQQNNDQLATQVAINRYQIRLGNMSNAVNDESLSAAQLKLERSEQLTDIERERLYWSYAMRYVAWELGYTLGTGNRNAFIEVFRDAPASLEYWRDFQRYLDPEFVNWMEENVVSQVAEQ